MVRRLVSLLLAVALLGMSGQGAAYAARTPGPMQSMHMGAADCMTMMTQAAPEKATRPGKSKRCTPTDCLNYMIACAGLSAALPNDPTPSLLVFDVRELQRPGLASPIFGRSLPPDIQPPIG